MIEHPRVIPCMLLRGRDLVKTIKFRDPIYLGDPLNVVKLFNDKEVDELFFLDITASTEGRRPDLGFIKEIASECFMPLGYGGGVRNVEDMHELFRLGVEKVAINSAAVDDPKLIGNGADLFGSQAIVVSVDVREGILGEYQVFTQAGVKNTGIEVVEYVKRVEKLGAGEIFLNSIDRDGTMQGYDLALVKKVTESVSIPVVACGGAGTLTDLKKVINEGGASAASAGSLFVFHGKHRAVLINYPTQEELTQVFS